MNRRDFCQKGLFTQSSKFYWNSGWKYSHRESQGQMPHVSSLQSHGDRGWSIHYLVSNIQTNHLCFPALSVLSQATAWRYEKRFLVKLSECLYLLCNGLECSFSATISKVLLTWPFSSHQGPLSLYDLFNLRPWQLATKVLHRYSSRVLDHNN